MRLRAGFLRSRLDLAVLPRVYGAVSSLPAERVPCGVRHELPGLTLGAETCRPLHRNAWGGSHMATPRKPETVALPASPRHFSLCANAALRQLGIPQC
jgi:hypothetical protein